MWNAYTYSVLYGFFSVIIGLSTVSDEVSVLLNVLFSSFPPSKGLFTTEHFLLEQNDLTTSSVKHVVYYPNTPTKRFVKQKNKFIFVIWVCISPV